MTQEDLTLEGQPWFRHTCNSFAIHSSTNQACRGAAGLNTWTGGRGADRKGGRKRENCVYKAFEGALVSSEKGL